MDAAYRTRPAARDDLDGVVEVMTAAMTSGGRAVRFPARDFLQWQWLQAGLDMALDTRVVLSPEGGVVAYAGVSPPKGSEPVEVEAIVLPSRRGRGIGTAMVAWGEARVAALGGSVARAAGWDAPGDELLRGLGYRQVRTMWDMSRAVAADEPSPEPPPGISIRTMDPDRDARAFWAAQMEAFSEHFGFVEQPFEDWNLEMSHPGFDPSQWVLATDGDEVAGVLIQVTAPEVAYVAVLGVRPAWRGRGIAKALLRWSFADVARRGFREISLTVDSQNETGATALYEAVGMTPSHGFHLYERALDSG